MTRDDDPADVARAAFLASNRGDRDAFLACLHPDVEWQSLGIFLRPARVWRGHTEIRTAFEGRGGRHPRVTLTSITSEGDLVLVTAALQDPDGDTLPEAWILELRDGLVHRVSAYTILDAARAHWRLRTQTGPDR